MPARTAPTPALPWEGRRVVLAVTGGIACYKAISLARNLTLRGALVDVLLTDAARRFLQPLVFEGVTGRPVLDTLWSAEGAARHIALAREADVVLVAPCTADLLARAAQGRAEDLVTTILLATRAPVLLAPAMNDRMWAHPQVQANARHVEKALGYRLIGPDVGPLAVGEGEGPGRMVEPEVLELEVGRALAEATSGERWRGRPVLVTSGPTREPVDAVRYLGNRSSGVMGQALAVEAWLRGGDVTLVTGPTGLPDPWGIRVIRVESAAEMAAAVRKAASPPQNEAGLRAVHLFAAAVSDFRPATPEARKWKKSEGAPAPLVLAENADVSRVARDVDPGAWRFGFALETEALAAQAEKKLTAKHFDWIFANPAGEAGAGFGSATNRGLLLGRDGTREAVGTMSKEALARRILDTLESALVHDPAERNHHTPPGGASSGEVFSRGEDRLEEPPA